MSRLTTLATAALLGIAAATPLAAQQASKPAPPATRNAPAPRATPAMAPAASGPRTTPSTASPATTPTVTVREAKPGLLAKASIKPEAAEGTALRTAGPGKITAAALQERGGSLVYVFTVTRADRSAHEVTINAMTGSVIPAETPAKKHG